MPDTEGNERGIVFTKRKGKRMSFVVYSVSTESTLVVLSY